ncbi:acetyl-hydrolase-like protein [Cadophora sp. MPI-SDFR-AT-0126]|nr:acetyl-hydrolase-like protein [Leotiomycetes sp. MPI-SDFR-AT-0126]
MLKAILPKVPLIGKTAISHTLGFSEHSQYWDLRTELIINVLRSFINDSPPRPLSQLQRMSLKGPEVKGRIWVSRITMPKPQEDDVRQKLFKAIEGLREEGDGEGGFMEPELRDVEAEWVGYRAGATKASVELKIPEKQKYEELMKEVGSPTTVLYFHGGAYYLMDPATHRPTTKKLAKLTKGRCLSVRYRLAPQNPFPSALLDALLSYLTLLYPPPNSFHAPVSASHIVFAGDSAGGNLSLALLQTLLELQRQNLKITWNGQEREIPLPAGLAVCSPWTDITHSSPSCSTNRKYDYLPSLAETNTSTRYPPDSIWPANPPRKNLYAEDSMLCHPLVSPLSAKSWSGSPPMFIETGQELLTDEDRYVAMIAARQGVKVVYEEYETMPHCFAMVLEGLDASRMFFDGWAGFIKGVVEGPEGVEGGGRVIAPKTLEVRTVDVQRLNERSGEEVRKGMRERVKAMSGEMPDPMAKL